MRSSAILAMTLSGVLTAGIPAAAQDNAASVERIASLKESAIAGVEDRRKLSQVMNDTVFSFGELAYQEFETSKYLTDLLEKNGFSVERGVAGMPTAWVARWGSGPWRGSQFRTISQHRRDACGKGADGTREAFGNAGRLAGCRRGAFGR